MTFEENREFSQDLHGLVKPLSEHCVGVVLDYWQIFAGPNSTGLGPFLSKYGFTGIDTAGQCLLSPTGELLAAHRSWKTGKGFTEEELEIHARQYPTTAERANTRRLSWFLIDPDYFRRDVVDEGARARYVSAVGSLQAARKMRRPLIRVDGAALNALESHQEFLSRHLRQFWWSKGDPNAPARLVVLNPFDTDETHQRFDASSLLSMPSNELTGSCPPDKTPTVMATLDLSGDVDLAKISPVLDECWRLFMEERPSNADNLTFAKDNIGAFKSVDAHIRELAKNRTLRAPGGRALMSP